MEQLSKKEYLESFDYKTVFILSKFRRIACLIGSEICDKMYFVISDALGTKTYIYDKSFLSLVEAGFIQLNEEAIKIYVKYISDAYKYDFGKFYAAVKYEAMNMELGDDECKNNKAALKAISGIYAEMLKK